MSRLHLPVDPAVTDPGGPLLVTPVGGFAVATDGMLAAADRLRALEARLHDDERRAAAADAIHPGVPVPELRAALDRVRGRCADLREAIARAAAEYGETERVVSAVQHELGARLATLLGPILHSAVILAPGPLLALALAGRWYLSGDERAAAIERFVVENPELVSSPEFVRHVSILATSVDDLQPSILGVPIGPRGGAEASALALLGTAGLVGLMREGHVRTDRVGTIAGGSAPVGVRERFDRIPEGDQVRIERYDAHGMPPRFTVYIGPTETFSPHADREPWDLTSNVAGVAGLSPGSLRAVEQAMADAGVAPGHEVQVIGYSQGGLIATLVAASGDWNVVGVETHGAPTGGIRLPDGLSGMAIRNTDDFIPALGGPRLDDHLLQVEREAFAGDAALPEQLVPAHQRVAYERTADAIDAAASSAVREQVQTFDAFGADYLERGGTLTVTTYHSERVDGFTKS